MTAKVFHAELWGTRKKKYTELLGADLRTTKWQNVSPDKPFYLFKPQDVKRRAEYDECWHITQIMPVNVLGFQTHRDHFAIDFDEAALRERIGEMLDSNLSDVDYARKNGLQVKPGWSLARSRHDLRADSAWERKLITCLYRPFDWRFCYFSEIVMDRPRRELLDHVAGRRNLCLGLGRQGIAVNDPAWSLISASRDPVDANIFRRGGINIFPLYLFPAGGGAAKQKELGGAHANLTPKSIAEVEKRIGQEFVPDGTGDLTKTFGPEDVFHYIYAVFHSPTYRERYAEFLKIDFPRVPFTSDKALFRKLCGLGAELTGLHLMEKFGPPLTSYPVKGDNTVAKVAYTPPTKGEKGRVWINKAQYFDGVPPEVWQFHVGGYQVCEKWLKDRKGRELSFEDLEHYGHIVSALSETIRLMAEIDRAIPQWPIQ